MLRFARRLAFPLCVLLSWSCAEANPAAPDPAEKQALSFHLDGGDFWDHVPDVNAIARFEPGAVPLGGSWSAARFIGPEGGSLRFHDYEIVIPAGAVDRVRRFEIRISPFQSQRKYAAVWLSPHGYQFAKPVTLRMPLATTESAGDPDPHVLWWDDHEWVALPTSLTGDGRIETTTTHFSLYATQRRGFTLAGG